ncbi:hypothetical protein KIL84_009102 [Mauremys mutica]|uniref:Uncharacterized protein n=1 Tax=Mauremys mutica TaxID=74926 RepID=A0A9D3XIB1_9SAUR|nr:hypothetical protein KIL84_009102 [Mauremys mutica]
MVFPFNLDFPGSHASGMPLGFQCEVSEKQHLKLAGTKKTHLLPITICQDMWMEKVTGET